MYESIMFFYVVLNFMFMLTQGDKVVSSIERNGFKVKHLLLAIILFPSALGVSLVIAVIKTFSWIYKRIVSLDISSRFSRLMNRRLF